jgi:hypothetical protein
MAEPGVADRAWVPERERRDWPDCRRCPGAAIRPAANTAGISRVSLARARHFADATPARDHDQFASPAHLNERDRLRRQPPENVERDAAVSIDYDDPGRKIRVTRKEPQPLTFLRVMREAVTGEPLANS